MLGPRFGQPAEGTGGAVRAIRTAHTTAHPGGLDVRATLAGALAGLAALTVLEGTLLAAAAALASSVDIDSGPLAHITATDGNVVAAVMAAAAGVAVYLAAVI